MLTEVETNHYTIRDDGETIAQIAMMLDAVRPDYTLHSDPTIMIGDLVLRIDNERDVALISDTILAISRIVEDRRRRGRPI